MNDAKYAVAGWLAIIASVLVPLAFILSIIQGVIAGAAFGYTGPIFGPSEALFIGITVISVYVLLVFRRLLNDRYQYHGIDTLIVATIIWNILFQFASLGLRGLLLVAWPESELAMKIVYILFLSIAMISIGIIDILMALRLIQVKDRFNDALRAFAYVTLAGGILEVSVFLSPLSLILVPVTFVILGLLFLREKEEAEFI